MDKQIRIGGSGIGCLTVVGIVFLVLKLLAVEPIARWSWVWVLCPFWIQFALSLFVAIGFFVVAFIISSRR